MMQNFARLKLTFVVFSFLLCTSSMAGEKVPVSNITPGETFMPMLLGLCGILLIIFLLAMVLKKVNGLNLVSSHIKLIESQSLGAKEKLVIVEIQDQQFVLGVTPHAINKICQLQNKVIKKPSSIPFEKMMKQFLHPQKSTMSQPLFSTVKSSSEG